MINEGLEPHILDHLILPLISIDEYHSKISDKKAIVVGFYSNQREPAMDLSNFIDKSDVETLDTEVSPAPNPHGFYMVFVEILRDKDFPDKLMSIIDEINNLTNVKQWWFRTLTTPKRKALILNKDNVKKHIIFNEDKITIKESLNLFFDASVSQIGFQNNFVKIGKTNYKIIDKPIIAESFDENDYFKSIALNKLLGNSFNVVNCGTNIFHVSNGIETIYIEEIR